MVSLDDIVVRRAACGFCARGDGRRRRDADGHLRPATTGNPKGVMPAHNTTLAAARIFNGDLGARGR